MEGRDAVGIAAVVTTTAGTKLVRVDVDALVDVRAVGQLLLRTPTLKVNLAAYWLR